MLWNIPTHAEWAIQYIQAEGLRIVTEKQNTDAKATDLKYTHDLNESASPSNQDFASYRSQFDKTPGHLIINATGVRFVAKRPPHEVRFSLPYVQINQLEKQDRYVEKMIKILKECDRDLRFLDRNGHEWILHEVEKRDEAFSQIVGFSRTTWQVLW